MRADAEALARLLDQLPPSDAIEIIVASAGPDTALDALRAGRPDVLWVQATPGRGVQLNAGARRAAGKWLWFVHADSDLPPGWLEAFQGLDDGVVGGSFAFALRSAAWQARVIERLVSWRVRWMNLPYGDQGIFVRREVFHSMKGFRPLPLMEDVEFVRRLTREGALRHLSLRMATSARRWERDGWWRRSAGNLAFLGLYGLGVSPGWLARRYYR